MKPINEKISDLRKAKGLTQEALGAKLGVSGQAVSKWEKGESLPDILLLPDLCKLLGTSADDLLDVPKPQTEPEELIRVEDSRGFTFEMRGTKYREDCMKLSCGDVARYLSVLTNEVTFRVLKTIPFIGDESITQAGICAATGYSDAEVGKVLRYLTKRELICEADLPEEDAHLSYDELAEPRYVQSAGGMIGIYLVLAGCMGSCESDLPEASESRTTTNHTTNVHRTTEDGVETTVIVNSDTNVTVNVEVESE